MADFVIYTPATGFIRPTLIRAHLAMLGVRYHALKARHRRIFDTYGIHAHTPTEAVRRHLGGIEAAMFANRRAVTGLRAELYG